jgi:hypothetical protein
MVPMCTAGCAGTGQFFFGYSARNQTAISFGPRWHHA